MECEYEKRKKCDSLYIERYNKLLKEIERLKEENKKYNKWVESLNKDNHRLNNIIKTKDEGFKASIEELTDYANRIDKAIEVLKLCNSKCSKEVINILRGKDNENN